MNVYQTDQDGYFVGEVEARESPLDPGAFLIPAGCVTAAPPATAANEAAQFVDGAWVVQPDFRGEVYWLADGTRHEIAELGIVLPAGALEAAPPPTLTEVKTDKLNEIDATYASAIQQSVAYMGTLFQADNASQGILLATLTVLTPMGGTPAGFWWKDQSNNQVPMTLAQLQGLAQTMFAQGWAAFQQRDSLKAQVEAATDAAAVNAVTW